MVVLGEETRQQQQQKLSTGGKKTLKIHPDTNKKVKLHWMTKWNSYLIIQVKKLTFKWTFLTLLYFRQDTNMKTLWQQSSSNRKLNAQEWHIINNTFSKIATSNRTWVRFRKANRHICTGLLNSSRNPCYPLLPTTPKNWKTRAS